MADSKQAGPPPSAWSPLAVPAFRTVWTATLVANIGAWVASVGTGWLMTTLDPSPIWVSLVSAATALPMFLFALPAGALADIVDRRKLLIVAQIFMLAVMVVLCVLTVMGAITPITLLNLSSCWRQAPRSRPRPFSRCCRSSCPRTSSDRRWRSTASASTSHA